jgi:hypothetical protein
MDDKQGPDRSRNYGKIIGDRVVNGFKHHDKKGTVIELGFMDNNSVYVLWDGEEKAREEVAEWLDIIDEK